MPHEELMDAMYFTGGFGAMGSALHSIVPVLVVLGLYWLFGPGRFDRRRILLWFLLGWAGHTVADFLTHVYDARPLFWPLSGWEWSSPVSYYNPRYYGREFAALEHASILAIMAALLWCRLRGRGERGRGKQGFSRDPVCGSRVG